jgi:hypothetical protein
MSDSPVEADDGFGWAVPLDEPTVAPDLGPPPTDPPADESPTFLLRGYDDAVPSAEFRPRLRLAGDAA